MSLLSGLAKAAGASMPRARKRGDASTVARKRYTRRAERLQKQAETQSGAQRKRTLTQMEENLRSAAETYENKSYQNKFIARAKKDFGVDLGKVKTANKEDLERLVKRSERALEGISPELQRERTAQEILSNKDFARRLYGSTVEIWGDIKRPDGKVDRSRINAAIMEYFDAKDMLEVIEKFEERFPDLYDAETKGEDKYDSIVTRAQKWIRDIADEEEE